MVDNVIPQPHQEVPLRIRAPCIECLRKLSHKSGKIVDVAKVTDGTITQGRNQQICSRY